MKILQKILWATLLTTSIISSVHAGVYSEQLNEFNVKFAPENCEYAANPLKCAALQNKPEVNNSQTAEKKATEAKEKSIATDSDTGDQTSQPVIPPFSPDIDGNNDDQLIAKCIFEWCCRWCDIK